MRPYAYRHNPLVHLWLGKEMYNLVVRVRGCTESDSG